MPRNYKKIAKLRFRAWRVQGMITQVYQRKRQAEKQWQSAYKEAHILNKTYYNTGDSYVLMEDAA